MKPLEEMGKFKTVVVDPPWPNVPTGLTAAIRGRKVSNYGPQPYISMPIEEIAALPLSAVSEQNAWLFCWTTTKFLPITFGLLEDWDFNYSFTMSWVKSKGPQYPEGPCYNTEFIVVGRKGSPWYMDCKAFRTGNFWQSSAHSAKPEGFYDLLRRVTPGPRLDIFGRRRIAGFESWGNEAPDGPALPDQYQQVFDL